MKLVVVVYFFMTFAVTVQHLNMYWTRKIGELKSHEHDCLYYYVRDGLHKLRQGYPSFRLTHQFLPYCQRSTSDDKAPHNDDNIFHENAVFSFSQLVSYKITSQDLISWSADIDLAEDYQLFLDNPEYATNGSFQNCTRPWFGIGCHYSFEVKADPYSFTWIIESVFRSKGKASIIHTTPTCYQHPISCDLQPWLFCLDWREICDGNLDCLGGEDEAFCNELESNECSHDEYRCHNGQCIPSEFLREDTWNQECLDHTDEAIGQREALVCAQDPAVRCEDHTCPAYQLASSFPCGDGQCTHGRKAQELCDNKRDAIVNWATIETLPELKSTCLAAMACVTKMVTSVNGTKCSQFCATHSCRKLIKENCPSKQLFRFPSSPVAFNHVYLVYENEQEEYIPYWAAMPIEVCYIEALCPQLKQGHSPAPGIACRNFATTVRMNLTTVAKIYPFDWHHTILRVKNVFGSCLRIQDGGDHSSITSYRCLNSTKYISHHRFLDGRKDCPWGEDESDKHSCLPRDPYRFSCRTEKKCLALHLVVDGTSDCITNNVLSDDEGVVIAFVSDLNKPGALINGGINSIQSKLELREMVKFQTICDGVEENLPILVDGRNETDETECDFWKCTNSYTRCDGFWNCPLGEDEVNCSHYPLNCPSNHIPCVSNTTLKLMCLPPENIGDGNFDCIAGTDEPNPCRQPTKNTRYYYPCLEEDFCYRLEHKMCNKVADCDALDDERFCLHTSSEGICGPALSKRRSKEEEYLCLVAKIQPKKRIYHFRVQEQDIMAFPLLSLPVQTAENTVTPFASATDSYEFISWAWACHRGIRLRLRVSNVSYSYLCLCPPAYYGDFCQYQKHRISWTIGFRALTHWRTMFTLIIKLTGDKDGSEQSHEHLEVLALRDCNIKFNGNLLYNRWQKNLSSNYSLRIEAFVHPSLQFHAAWHYPVPFPFMPVNRMAIFLHIPVIPIKPVPSCYLKCIHGRCLPYANSGQHFCHCDIGWSGLKCHIPFSCNCHSSAVCSGKSVCVCPMDKFGRRCLLTKPSCASNACMNGGLCVSNDVRMPTGTEICICPQGYFGAKCEKTANRIDIQIRELPVPSNLLVHFITMGIAEPHSRATTLAKIPVDRNSATIYASFSFHLIFAEFDDTLYLAYLQAKHIPALHINTIVDSSRRCLPIKKVLSSEILSRHIIRRIKHYHIPCQKRTELVCFYTDVHVCFCEKDRTSNCFTFTHNLTYDCEGQNYCEQHGQCFQDDRICPTVSACACHDCTYGSRCQFSSNGFGLSLDPILGYHIRPGEIRSSSVVVVSIVVSTLIVNLGFVNGFVATLTFQEKSLRQIATCKYLFASSITSIFTLIMMALKFWFLVLAQTLTITNRTYLYLQCSSVDFLLRIFFSSNNWLNACVAIERTLTVMKGIKFNRNKSKEMAKLVIFAVLAFTILTNLHDPIHRRLVDDEEEQRIWCIARYSSFWQTFDSTVELLHFFVPFVINFMSAVLIVTSNARRRAATVSHEPYIHHILFQLRLHKHLLISPIILVALSIPRLLISFLPGCMKSARDPWLFLAGYFVSFTSTLVTFVIFVIPSGMYLTAFKRETARLRRQYSAFVLGSY